MKNYIIPIILVSSVLFFTLPILANFDYWGRHDWDQHQFYNAVPRITILKYRQFPLWNPYYCGGNVMLANPESGFLSPLYLTVLIFGVIHGLKISIILHFLLGVSGMYLLARQYGITKLGSILSAFIFNFSAVFSFHIAAGHTTHLPAFYIPWILYYCIKSINNRRYLIVSGLLSVLIIFEGGVYPFLFTMLFLFIYTLLEDIKRKKILLLNRFSDMVIVTLCVGAIKFFPMIEFINKINISKELDRGFNIAMFFHALMNRALNYNYAFFTNQTYSWHEYYSYIGIVTLVLVCLGMIIKFEKFWPLVITTFIFIILSFGTNSYIPLWQLLYKMPFFKGMHVPSRFIIIIIFSFAIFAGLFINRLEDKKIPKIFILLIILYIFFDLSLISRPILKRAFTIKPIEDKFNGEFHQEINERINPIFAPPSELYPYFLRNIGTINAYAATHLPINARGAQEKDYRGEVYYLKSDKKPQFLYFSPDYIVVNVGITSPDLLIVNQNYDSGWKDRKHFVKPYQGLISVEIFPKDQTVHLYYLPTSFLIGMSVTLISLIILSILYFKDKFGYRVKQLLTK